ncbi:transposase [Streptomyces sp. NPDC052109]|uniref:transposase n=1 Tax=Streptomyces sp. NPDC052109 TaxID=3155527 RepID=UPI00341CDFF7
MGFPPRERDLQVPFRIEQLTPEWKAGHAVRSRVEGTIDEFARGHGARRCRYRGQPMAPPQRVFTAIAANIERSATCHRPRTSPRLDRRPLSRRSWTSRESPGRSPGAPSAADLAVQRAVPPSVVRAAVSGRPVTSPERPRTAPRRPRPRTRSRHQRSLDPLGRHRPHDPAPPGVRISMRCPLGSWK